MSVLLQYLTNPSSNYISATKYTLRYLRRLLNIGIIYKARKGVLEGLYKYSNLDYIRCIET
jgi:hypothetical protein